jgi:EpsI family protein
MEKLKSRYIILIAILLLTSVIVGYLSYDTFNKAKAASLTIGKIPLKLGKWKGTDIPLDERVYDILETKAIINRSCVCNGSSVFLSVVYYPETKVGFHGPEECLGGKGIQISKSAQTIIISQQDSNRIRIDLNQLIRQKNGSSELVYYFFKAGNFIGRSYIRMRFKLAINKFFEREKSGALIRVSTPILDDNVERSREVLEDFVGKLYPFLLKL